jgi:hypothetical protein
VPGFDRKRKDYTWLRVILPYLQMLTAQSKLDKGAQLRWNMQIENEIAPLMIYSDVIIT